MHVMHGKQGACRLHKLVTVPCHMMVCSIYTICVQDKQNYLDIWVYEEVVQLNDCCC